MPKVAKELKNKYYSYIKYYNVFKIFHIVNLVKNRAKMRPLGSARSAVREAKLSPKSVYIIE